MFETDQPRRSQGAPTPRPLNAEPSAYKGGLPVYQPNYGDDDEHGETANDAIFRKLMGYYQQELDIQATQRAQMAKDEAMFDGDQWDAEAKAILEERGQLPLTFNVIAPALNWLKGTERRQRAQYKVLARSKRGTRSAERKSQLMKYVDDASAAEMARSLAFADAVQVGIGWLEGGYQESMDGEPVFSRYESWRNMLHDSRAQAFDLSDGRYLFRTRWTDLDTAKALFRAKEQHVVLEQAGQRAFDGLGGISDYGDDYMDAQEIYAEQTGGIRLPVTDRQRVKLIECWYRVPVDTQFMRGGEFDGEVYDEFSEGHWAELADGNAELVTRSRMRVHLAIMCPAGMLYNEPSPYRHNKFPFTPVIGNRRGSDGMFYGLIRGISDIQVDINKRASKALHILSTNKVIMDEGAVEDLDEFQEEVSRPDAIIVKKPGKMIDLNVDRELAPAHMEMFSRSVMMIQQLSGITDESMGRTTNAVSGRAINARQTQSAMATAHYLDHLRHAMRVHGEKQLSLIEQFFSDSKQFRIVNGRGTPEYVTINDGSEENDIIRTKADFVISEDDWKATIRQAQVEELLEVLQQLAPVAPQLVFVLLDLVVEAMDIPAKDEIVSRIRSVTGMEDPDQEPDPNDPEWVARQQAKQQKAEMEARAAMAQIVSSEADAEHKQAQAAKARADTLKTAQSIGADQLEQVRKALETAIQMLGARPAAPVADDLVRRADERSAAALQVAAGGAGQPSSPPAAGPDQPQPRAMLPA